MIAGTTSHRVIRPSNKISIEEISQAHSMQNVLNIARMVAPTDSSVLIGGETGTGKEITANAIHNASPRSDKPFVAVNCGAIPKGLLLSTLFGHAKGAFTGAVRDKPGKLQQANKGTLFLDEIGELSLNGQVALLRVMEDGFVEKVGGTKGEYVDSRIIAATNKDLKKMVADGKFREDLFYRLNVTPLYILPLRNRPEDIPRLSERFLEGHARKAGKDSPASFTDTAKECIQKYRWPGNVRELRNVIEFANMASRGAELIELEHLHPDVRSPAASPLKEMDGILIDLSDPDRDTLEAMRRAKSVACAVAFRNHNENSTKTADHLGITGGTLRRWLAIYKTYRQDSPSPNC